MAIGGGGISLLARSTVFWRGLGALVLGVLLAQWCWILFAPQATVIAIAPQAGAVDEAGRLFGQGGGGVTAADGAALSNVRLVGVFASRPGRPGFAVLKLDDKRQVGIVVGEHVVPGTKLLEVHPDYVLLERGGVQQRVNLEGKTAGASPANGIPVEPKWR